MDTAHTTAMGLGYGLACRDAELALCRCRDYARGRATTGMARDQIDKLRDALLEMERALDLTEADQCITA